MFYFRNDIIVITIPIFKGDAARITSISMDYIGRPVKVATGFDKKGVKKYYFVNQTHPFHPYLIYTVEADKGITKDKAISLALDNHLCKKVYKAILTYDNMSHPRKKLIYWRIVSDKDYYIDIDFFTGKLMK